MESPTLQPTAFDLQKLQELEDEIKQELSEVLKNSKLGQLMEKYGISEKILEIECGIDLSKIKVVDMPPSLTISNKRTFLSGCLCPCKGICPCTSTC
ncbi:hypothetical protein NIES4103_49630 [Nostoc sp. NIES-4103]|nr:hypothetical protein NIES4103_49630 [Nostoc sp. NIES-4103]